MKSKREIELEKCLEKTLKDLRQIHKYGGSLVSSKNTLCCYYKVKAQSGINRIQRVLASPGGKDGE